MFGLPNICRSVGRTATEFKRHLTEVQFYRQYSVLFSSCLRENNSSLLSGPNYAANGNLHCLKVPSQSQVELHRKRQQCFKSTQPLSSQLSLSHETPSGAESYPVGEPVPPGLLEKARQMAADHSELEKQLSAAYDSKLALRAGQLENVKIILKYYEQAVSDLDILLEMIKENDPIISSEAKLDYAEGITVMNKYARQLIEALVPPHQYAHLPAILEIRPGTGGSEASIFANDLLKMYLSYFSNLRWKATVMSIDTEPTQGGDALNEAIVSVDHPGSYDQLRLESGVHRVQRIPATETKGRVHTSTAIVMVLPSFSEEEKNIDLDSIIDPKDVRTDVMRSRGAGGQHVNTTDSAVRMTHIPTGTVAAIQDSRSQHKNREKCWSVLCSRVAAKIVAEKEEEELRMRRQSMGMKGEKGGGGGGRGDKLRTYNFSQNRVTDHRSGTSIHDMDAVMAGDEVVLGNLLKEVKKWRMEIDVKALEV